MSSSRTETPEIPSDAIPRAMREVFPEVFVLSPIDRDEVRAADPCIVCGDRRFTPRYGIAAMPQRLVSCDGCGLGRLEPVPDAHQIDAFYPEAYYGTRAAKFEPLVEAMIRFIAARHVRFLARGLPRRARVLDIGCGRGVLLHALAGRGYEAYGVEISASAAAGVDPRFDVRVAADLADAGYEAGFFDAVMIWHVLEHLPNPRKTLLEIRRILKPGGRLVVAVPNFSSWQARWAAEAWFHLDLPRHIYHFPLRALKTLLASTGFDYVSEHHFSLRQNPFGWVQSFLNKRRDLPRNGLYSMLHRCDDRTSGLESSVRRRLRIAYWLGMPIGLALSVIAAMVRNGATVHIKATANSAEARASVVTVTSGGA